MPQYRNALIELCDTIIKFASPTRGEPPPTIVVDRRDDYRPAYVPIFFPEVCKVKYLLARDRMLGESNKIWLEFLLEQVLSEAIQRRPHFPPYLDLALDICRYCQLESYRKWVFKRLDELEDQLNGGKNLWPDLFAYKIGKIAEGFRQATTHR